MGKIKELFDFGAIQKKVLMISKLMGGAIILFYLLTEEPLIRQGAGFWIWVGLLAGVIIVVDHILRKMISDPLRRINSTAKQMAALDFSAACDVTSKDEFGELSQSINIMFSNLRSALEELELANAQLAKDVKKERILLEQRKELADNLSHEMKTPLGLIRAYTESLNDEPDPEKQQQYIKAILDATERMDGLIVSLLDLSALEAGAAELDKERFDFVELTEIVAGRLLIDAPDTNFTFHYTIPEEKVFVLADKKRMEQVLGNLIENAKKYVLPGGEIRLKIQQENDHIHFSIFNQASLLDEQELSKIWNKFYRGSDQHHKGSGLGLAIVSQILSMYHAPFGVVNIENGIEFYFCFPTVK